MKDIKHKESFVLHLDMLQDVKDMSVDEKARFLTFIIKYNEGDASIDDIESGMFKSFLRLFTHQFDRDAEKWNKTRLRRAESGRKGGQQTQANARDIQANAQKAQANQAGNGNKNKNVNENVKINANDSGNVNVLNRRFRKEALLEKEAW